MTLYKAQADSIVSMLPATAKGLLVSTVDAFQVCAGLGPFLPSAVFFIVMAGVLYRAGNARSLSCRACGRMPSQDSWTPSAVSTSRLAGPSGMPHMSGKSAHNFV